LKYGSPVMIWIICVDRWSRLPRNPNHWGETPWYR